MFDGLDVNQEMHRGLPMMLKKLSNVNIVCIVGMLNEDENLKIGHALSKLRMMQLKWLLTQKTNIILGLAKSFVAQMWVLRHIGRRCTK